VNRKRQGLFGGPFTLGERAGLIAEIGKALLKMHGHGIVDLRAHVPQLQSGFQFIPARHTNHILIEDVAIRHDPGEQEVPRSVRRSVSCRRREGTIADYQSGLRKELIVPPRVPLARGRPAIQLRQFGRHHRGLNGFEPEITSDNLVTVLRLGTMSAQTPQLLRTLCIVRHDHPAIADPTQIL